VAFTEEFHNKCPLTYLFMVNLNKSEWNIAITG